MIERLIKYRLFFIVILLLFCTIFTESPYDVGYYREPSYLPYFLITLMNLLIYLIPTDKLIFAEKITYSIIISFIGLIFGIGFTLAICSLMYGYDSNLDELQSPTLLENALFYFITNFSGIGIFAVWLKYKKPIYQ